MSSGNGGACLVELGGSKVVIKGGSDTGAKNEILGSMLAREVGLQAPETRFLTDKEQGEISKGMSQQGVKMPHRQDGRDPVIVMEYVHGTPIHELDKGSVSSRDMAKSFGKWMAFASFINEPDTFHGLISGRQFTAGGGINSSNFLINPKDPRGGIAGIDQNVGSGDVSDLIHDISSGKDTFFYKAADLISRTAGDHTEADEIVDSVKEGAREVYEAIGKMSPDKIREFGEQLGIAKDTINVLLERQAQIRDGV